MRGTISLFCKQCRDFLNLSNIGNISTLSDTRFTTGSVYVQVMLGRSYRCVHTGIHLSLLDQPGGSSSNERNMHVTKKKENL